MSERQRPYVTNADTGDETPPGATAYRVVTGATVPDTPPAGDRESVIGSIIGSQALSGVEVPRDVAERIYDEVAAEPSIAIAPLITADPDIQSGEPCIAGTRVTTAAIGSFHRAGYDTAGIVGQYPHLTPAQVEAAVAFEMAEPTLPCLRCRRPLLPHTVAQLRRERDEARADLATAMEYARAEIDLRARTDRELEVMTRERDRLAERLDAAEANSSPTCRWLHTIDALTARVAALTAALVDALVYVDHLPGCYTRPGAAECRCGCDRTRAECAATLAAPAPRLKPSSVV